MLRFDKSSSTNFKFKKLIKKIIINYLKKINYYKKLLKIIIELFFNYY